MDPNGNLYSALGDEIPAEDKARLDGYMRARRDLEREEAVEGIEERVKLLEAIARQDARPAVAQIGDQFIEGRGG